MKIKLLKIKEKNLLDLMKWRMDDDVTKYMFTDPKLTVNSQREWYEKIKNDRTRKDYMIYVDSIPIGYYGISEIDNLKGCCNCGFYIGIKEYRGKGIYFFVQNQINKYLFEKKYILKIIIEVLSINPAIGIYEKLGFRKSVDERIIIKNGKEHVVYKYVKEKSDEEINVINNNYEFYIEE